MRLLPWVNIATGQQAQGDDDSVLRIYILSLSMFLAAESALVVLGAVDTSI